MKLEPVDVREINKHASNIYEAIIIASKKARLINDELKRDFTDKISALEKAGDDDDGEDLINPEQAAISMQYEKMEKPHIKALNLLLKDKIKYRFEDKRAKGVL